MNKIQMGILATCMILTIIVVSTWNMPNIPSDVQSKNLNEATNNSINQSNVIPLEKPPFLVEVRP